MGSGKNTPEATTLREEDCVRGLTTGGKKKPGSSPGLVLLVDVVSRPLFIIIGGCSQLPVDAYEDVPAAQQWDQVDLCLFENGSRFVYWDVHVFSEVEMPQRTTLLWF